MREMHLFALMDKEGDSHYTVTAIHDDRGYKRLRESLAQSYDIGYAEPNIQVVDVDLLAERHLKLRHNMHDRVPLSEKSRDAVLEHIRYLWGYEVTITGVDVATDEVVYEASTVDTRDST